MEVTRRSFVQAGAVVAGAVAMGSALDSARADEAGGEEVLAVAEASSQPVEFEEVVFGTYPQLMSGRDPVAPITWLVLSESGGLKLLLSKYCLDARPFNDVRDNNLGDVAWKDCTLRAWLNETFADTAFTEVERSNICPAHLAGTSNPLYGTEGGDPTEDLVFVPSIEELAAVLGFSVDADGVVREGLVARATNQAAQQGAFTLGMDGRCAWWLRNPGSRGMYAAQVKPDGSLDVTGEDVSSHAVAVRPALLLRG